MAHQLGLAEAQEQIQAAEPALEAIERLVRAASSAVVEVKAQ
jgi:hypothetical protein